MSSLPTIDQNTLGWIVTGGLIAIFALVWRVAVRIEGRLTSLEGRIKALEESPIIIAFKEFEIAQANRLLKAEEMLKGWESIIKDKLDKEKG